MALFHSLVLAGDLSGNAISLEFLSSLTVMVLARNHLSYSSEVTKFFSESSLMKISFMRLVEILAFAGALILLYGLTIWNI